MSTDDIDEAIDWRGAPVDCTACAHQDRLAEGKCKPLRACVHDRYARRIDRFFDWNPDLARDYVAHDYFEVRACAAKAAEIFLLPAMLDDPRKPCAGTPRGNSQDATFCVCAATRTGRFGSASSGGWRGRTFYRC